MLRVLLLLLAVAGLHARPLHQFPNGRLKPIWPDKAQHEDRDNMNTGVKPKKQTAVPVELRRQGTEPSRRFLMDLNTGMLKNSRATLVNPRTGQKLPQLSELQRRTAPLNEFRQATEHQPQVLHELKHGSEPSGNLKMDVNTGLLKENQHKMSRRSRSAKWEVVSGYEHEDIKSQDSSERKENRVAVPVELRRQGTEPSRRFLMDLNTGMLKKEVSEMNRRVSGFYNPPAYGKRQGTEPSRRFLMDLNTGMPLHEVGEMNRRVSGFYNPPAYEMRKGTQNSRATLVNPRTGQKLPQLSELQRRTAPLDELRQGTERQLHIQELRKHLHKIEVQHSNRRTFA